MRLPRAHNLAVLVRWGSVKVVWEAVQVHRQRYCGRLSAVLVSLVHSCKVDGSQREAQAQSTTVPHVGLHQFSPPSLGISDVILTCRHVQRYNALAGLDPTTLVLHVSRPRRVVSPGEAAHLCSENKQFFRSCISTATGAWLGAGGCCLGGQGLASGRVGTRPDVPGRHRLRHRQCRRR